MFKYLLTGFFILSSPLFSAQVAPEKINYIFTSDEFKWESLEQRNLVELYLINKYLELPKKNAAIYMIVMGNVILMPYLAEKLINKILGSTFSDNFTEMMVRGIQLGAIIYTAYNLNKLLYVRMLAASAELIQKKTDYAAFINEMQIKPNWLSRTINGIDNICTFPNRFIKKIV